MTKKIFLTLFVVLLVGFVVKADIAPPKGYSQAKVNFIAETADDLSDYRFFFEFSGALNEVKINSKGQTNIPPLGGGARYLSGDFLAIPKTSLAEVGENLSYEQLNALSDSIEEGKIAGVINLGSHTFRKTVKGIAKDSASIYIISRQDNSLKMSPKKVTPKKKGVAFFESEDKETDSRNMTIGGIFLSLFLLTGGVFLFRKSK